MKRFSFFLISVLITLSIFKVNICEADINLNFEDSQLSNTQYPISYYFEEKDKDYKESQLRRFEIIFFISMPVSIVFSLLGIEAYKIASKNTGEFKPIEYRYLIASTLCISLSIAINDNLLVSKKEKY